MKNETTTLRKYSSDELAALRVREGSQSDFARVRAKSNEELERDIQSDEDFRAVPQDWYEAANAAMPTAKTLLSVRLDREVIDWFKQEGPGYQTRMNAVLLAFVRSMRQKAADSRSGANTPG